VLISPSLTPVKDFIPIDDVKCRRPTVQVPLPPANPGRSLAPTDPSSESRQHPEQVRIYIEASGAGQQSVESDSSGRPYSPRSPAFSEAEWGSDTGSDAF